METTIAKYIASILSTQRIESSFTVPGSSCISMNNALNDEGILSVLSGSEESATHAAHGYAAIKETFGCAVVSRGPAATNTITGLVTASEGYPILVIIGDNASTVRQKNMATQDLPLEKIFEGVCDYATIDNPTRTEEVMCDILDKLVHQKKSCALIVPSDMWNKRIYTRPIRELPLEGKHLTDITPHSTIIQTLPKTERNLLLVGSGILNNRSLRLIAESVVKKYNVPFVVSTRGLGYPLPQKVGWVGIMGEPEANSLLYEADHIIILDESLETATTGAISDLRHGRIVTSISLNGSGQSNFKPDYDIRLQSDEFAAFFESLARRTKFIGNNTSKCSLAKTNPETILESILSQLPDQYTVCLDSGQNFFWGAHALTRVNKHRVIYSYTQATMGFGLPALVGMSSISSQTLLICGDGGFLMSSEELSTIYNAGFKGRIIILNNSMLGMIYQTQKIKGLPKLAIDVKIHNLKKVVEGYGWDYISMDSLDESAIEKFLTSENNCVLNIQLDKDESVYPRGSTSERLPTR